MVSDHKDDAALEHGHVKASLNIITPRARSALHAGDFSANSCTNNASFWPDICTREDQLPPTLWTPQRSYSENKLSSSSRKKSRSQCSMVDVYCAGSCACEHLSYHARASSQTNASYDSSTDPLSHSQRRFDAPIFRSPHEAKFLDQYSYRSASTRQQRVGRRTASCDCSVYADNSDIDDLRYIEISRDQFSKHELPLCGHFRDRNGAKLRSFLSEKHVLRASLVGSYEESILSGRMSTTPSPPLQFLAQIGVLGIGKCRNILRCPPHASIPFPAVFYSYNSEPRILDHDRSSPYVGLIDLENGPGSSGHMSEGPARRPVNNTSFPKRSKQIRRSFFDIGSSYEIPKQGQIQIIIKNPNKTAIKLFLVPYDLEGMRSGHKTFVRQRSYSTEMTSGEPFAITTSSSPTSRASTPERNCHPQTRPILRYLVHLNICSPSEGHYYLYKSIRVVFASCVTAGKEKIHNETQLPDPKFSPLRNDEFGIETLSHILAPPMLDIGHPKAMPLPRAAANSENLQAQVQSLRSNHTSQMILADKGAQFRTDHEPTDSSNPTFSTQEPDLLGEHKQFSTPPADTTTGILENSHKFPPQALWIFNKETQEQMRKQHSSKGLLTKQIKELSITSVNTVGN